jgi:glutamyl-tRNA reductase
VSVVVIGLNHRTAPLDVLERMTVDGANLGKALHDLTSRDQVSEAVLLSTCNRTEVYAVVERFHPAFADVRNFFSELAFLPPEGFADHLYVHDDADAVEHLFSVAAGLDSDVIGEVEILGQVRAAWARAQLEDAAGPQLNMLFRHAVEFGKRARSETDISRHIASVSSAAVAMAADRLEGGLVGSRILVLGAGDMATGMVRSLAGAGAAEVLVANRTHGKAEALASTVGGRAIRLHEIGDALEHVDLLLTSTGASSMMLEHGEIAGVIERRAGRHLLIVDIAVPRDVDPTAGLLRDVTLLDMDDLRTFAEAGQHERRGEVEAVRELLVEDVERYRASTNARSVAPLVTALRDRAEEVRASEVDRYRSKLAGLDDAQLDAVEAITRSIVAKLVHEPTVGLKGAAGTARGERLADALRDLFDL